jgi:hypothetical protein
MVTAMTSATPFFDLVVVFPALAVRLGNFRSRLPVLKPTRALAVNVAMLMGIRQTIQRVLLPGSKVSPRANSHITLIHSQSHTHTFLHTQGYVATPQEREYWSVYVGIAKTSEYDVIAEKRQELLGHLFPGLKEIRKEVMQFDKPATVEDKPKAIDSKKEALDVAVVTVLFRS